MKWISFLSTLCKFTVKWIQNKIINLCGGLIICFQNSRIHFDWLKSYENVGWKKFEHQKCIKSSFIHFMKRLTEEMIFAKKTKLRSLTDVYHLYMWGMSLEDVSLIQKLPNIKSISLSMNCIETLQQFSHCKNLQELFLRKNKISSLSELYYLSELENLPVFAPYWL